MKTKKQFLFLLLLGLLCSVGNVWGSDYSSTPLISADFSSMSNGTPTAISGVTYHGASISSGKLTWGGNWSEGSRDVQVEFSITGTACKLVLGHVTGSSMGIKGILYKGSTKVNDFTGSAWSLGNSKTSDEKEFTGLTAGTYTLKLGPGGQSARSVITSIAIYDEASSDPVDPTITFNDGEYNVGDAALDLSSLFSSNSSGAVTYTVTNAGSTKASIEGTSFTATAAGSATVRASQAAASGYNAKTAIATITVTNLINTTFTVKSHALYEIGNSLTLSSLITENNSDGGVSYTIKSGTSSTGASLSDGVFSATTAGTAVVTISVAQTATHTAASEDVTIFVGHCLLGANTITYTLDVTASEDKKKTDINSEDVSTTLYLNSLVGITNNTSGSYGTGSKANLTVKIPTDASYTPAHYMSVGFTVEDGYAFVPTSISVKAQPVTSDKHVKLILTDGINSIEYTSGSLTAGTIATVTGTNDDGITLSGAVTLKIYCYDATDTYRLGSPITIEGNVIEAVSIKPSYAKTTYVTTENLNFTGVDGIKAYVATSASAAGVVMTELDAAVPSGTPLLLIGTAGTTYYVPVVASADAPASNLLEVGDGTTVFNGSTPDYILYSDGLFYQIGSGTVATDKAYLHLDSAPGAAGLRILFEEEHATDIQKIEAAEEGVKFIENGKLYIKKNNIVYDAMGRVIR